MRFVAYETHCKDVTEGRYDEIGVLANQQFKAVSEVLTGLWRFWEWRLQPAHIWGLTRLKPRLRSPYVDFARLEVLIWIVVAAHYISSSPFQLYSYLTPIGFKYSPRNIIQNVGGMAIFL